MPSIADVTTGVFVVDGVRYKTIGDAYKDCSDATRNYAYPACLLMGYNTSSGIQGISNQNTVRFGVSTSTLTGSPLGLPGSLTAPTAVNFGVPVTLAEP